MSQYYSILTGIHPLSETLIKRIFDFKYGRASSPEHVKIAFEKDIKDLITLLSDAFPIAISIGNLGWWDLFRPFSEKLQGLSRGDGIGDLPVARNPLTNTFYRQPIVEGEISHTDSVLLTATHPFLDGNIIQTKFLPMESRRKGWSLCLPGPFSFSRAVIFNSEGQKIYRTRNDFMNAFSQILKHELSYLSKEGFSHIIIDESSLAWEEVDTETLSLLGDLWNQIIASSSLKIIFHTYQNLNEEKFQLLLESKAWAIGIDCVANNPRELANYDFNGKNLLAGVVDAQSYLRDANDNLLVETDNELVKLGSVLAKTEAENIILAPTTRLEFVPRSVADLKIQQLGKAIAALRG
ncbi:MAG: hypothetical protein ACFFB2_06410 [Promethearchaeota archaeon]